jgi:hypothetical protein
LFVTISSRDAEIPRDDFDSTPSSPVGCSDGRTEIIVETTNEKMESPPAIRQRLFSPSKAATLSHGAEFIASDVYTKHLLQNLRAEMKRSRLKGKQDHGETD